MSKRVGVIGTPGGWSSEKLATALEERTGFRALIDLETIKFDLERKQVIWGEVGLRDLDALVVKKIGSRYSPDLIDRLEILDFLHRDGLPIFSSPSSMLRAVNRLSCTVTLRDHDIPMPPTVVTEDPDVARQALEEFGDAILKPLFTSKARGMVVASAGSSAEEQIAQFRNGGHAIMYIQKKIEVPGRDLGVAFLGGKYLATYARVGNRKSWNTTTQSGGHYEKVEPTEEILELARRAQAPFHLDFTGVDIVETPEGLRVFEVSAFGGFRGLWEAHGIDAAGLYADYVLERISKG
jgi:ribosomal protein S6--L-glutamate ligase